jgi:DNA-directed RNA polymerase specialized sigma24 family protein
MPTPTTTEMQRLLQVAYRAAARVVRNKLLAEEAGERALHRYQLAILSGQIPDRPEAWIRCVATRSACGLLRSGWSRVQPLADAGEVAERPDLPAPPVTPDELREQLAPWLTRRQRDALEAALTCRSTREAARACQMQPRDFRRYLAAISRAAKARLTPAGTLAPERQDPSKSRTKAAER